MKLKCHLSGTLCRDCENLRRAGEAMVKCRVVALLVVFSFLTAFAVAAPTISSLSPTSGAVGASVTITGTNFGSTQGTSTVKFNGKTASVTSWGSTSISAIVPTGATTGNVVVTVSGVASNGKSFTVVAAPSITSLSPTSAAVGISVTVSGSGFGSTQGSSTVKFNGTTGTPTSWNSTTIKVPVPTGATTGNLVVHASGLDSNGKPFTVLSTPAITGLSPNSGMVGDTVTITGTNFGATQGTSTVKFNGVTAISTSWSDNSINTTVPTGATTGNVVVTVSGVPSAGANFTVVATPSISSLAPSSGAVGALITINGSNFQPAQGSSTVTFNGISATPTSWTATQIKALVPPGATSGSIVVTVFGLTSNARNFNVLPTPTIKRLSQTVGTVGMAIAIDGTNLGYTQGSSTLKFNGVTATPTSWTDTSILAPVPVGATTGNVVVHANGVDTNGINFVVSTVTSIAVTPQNISVPINSVQRFTATATYASGHTEALTGNANWTSSDASVATVDSYGVATAISLGQTTLQAVVGSSSSSGVLDVTPQNKFTVVGNLNIPRWGFTATALPYGKVLIAGGFDSDSRLVAQCELYDPATGSFTFTGTLLKARFSHTATLLSNGKVLIAGGASDGGPEGTRINQAIAELYDPETGAMGYAGFMNIARSGHTATLLSSGLVLIAGGYSPDSDVTIAELYDPATYSFTYTGSLHEPRSTHTATLLNDGTVLLAGGMGESSSSALGTAERYDPTTGTYAVTGSLNIASHDHTATLLSNGKVLIAGGADAATLDRAELYDPATGLFTPAGRLALARTYFTGTLLNTGQVLFVGGDVDNTIVGTAELYDPSTAQFIGAGTLSVPRYMHQAALMSNGSVLMVGGFGATSNLLPGAEVYSEAPPPPSNLRVTPSTVTMQVGETREFTASDGYGNVRMDATWSVGDASVATITPGSPPILTAIAPGRVTVTANAEGVTAQAQVTVVAQGALVPGSALWAVPPKPGFTPLQLAQAVPTSDGPDLYSVQLSTDGTQTVVQALTTDGQSMWQKQLPRVTANSVPDGSGGLIATEYNTQTDPMRIVRIDPMTGETTTLLEAAGVQGPNGLTYLPPDDTHPQFAIRGDGAVVVAAMTNNGLPPLTIDRSSVSIPESTDTQPGGTQFSEFSPTGPPIVDSDGTVYMEYEVRQIAYPPRITSAVLYLLRIAQDNTRTDTLLSTTTEDANLMPGRIIPDGQGGVLATWGVYPNAGPNPMYPFKAAHVTANGVTTYDLPFTPKNLSSAKQPVMVLGENGTVFASGTSVSTDDPDKDVSQIVAFDVGSGAVNWTYKTTDGGLLSIVAATQDGVAVSSSVSGIIHFDSSGTAAQITGNLGAIAQYSWNGDWHFENDQGVHGLNMPLVVDDASTWATPEGNASKNGGAGALCGCSAQSSESEGALGTQAYSTRVYHAIAATSSAPPTDCPICSVTPPSPPLQLTSCLTIAGSGPTHLMLIADPGKVHFVGYAFALAAQQKANELQAQGNNKVIACRVSTIQDVDAAINGNGFIDGEVHYFGHSGLLGFRTDGVITAVASMLFVGQGDGSDANVYYGNVSQICNAQSGCHVDNVLSSNTAIRLYGCMAGKRVLDYYAQGPTSIAQLISNQLRRGVYAYEVGVYFSSQPPASDTHFDGTGRTAPSDLPVYMVPAGAPGNKPDQLPFTPK